MGNLKSFTPINKGQFTLETPEREKAFESNRSYGVEQAYRENRFQWEAYPRTQHVADYPLHVDIELSSICNLKCPMCYTITEQFKSKVNTGLMDFQLFKKIVDECASAKVFSIRLSLRGESFLHPRIVDCVAYAKNQGIKEVSTLTNGLRLDEKMFTEVMAAGIDWITISFDGLEETYEKIRRPAKFQRAVEKIANYAKLKRSAGRRKPVIKIQSVLPAIQDDPDAFYAVFAPISDLVSANPLIDYLQNDDSGSIIFEDNFCCPQIFQRLVVGADGLAMMCANDEENEHVVGDLNYESLHQIWQGEVYQRARETHKSHNGVQEYAICRKCYLPRKTEKKVVHVEGRELIAENYLKRSQIIGT
jgi:radical SAM protein with 4Fe4S-binding SPASM domain